MSGAIFPFTYMTSLCTDEQLNICVTKTNPIHHLTSAYFTNQTLHVSGICVAHHQEIYCIYIYIYIYIYNSWYVFVLFSWLSVGRPVNRPSIEKHNTYQLLYIYSISPGDGLQICPKHVEFDWRNKLKIGGVSGWFLLHRCIEMHGLRNIQQVNMLLHWYLVCFSSYTGPVCKVRQ